MPFRVYRFTEFEVFRSSTVSFTAHEFEHRVWYYEPRDFNPDCEHSLSFLSL